MDLIELGWNSLLQEQYEPYRERGYSVGRVITEHRQLYDVASANGEVLGELAGKLRFTATERTDLPAVGDWVVMREEGGRAVIQAVLPRKSMFSRNVAGAVTEEQIVAANIDTVFLVMALNQDFNLRRMERYLLLAWESGANPVIVLSKADLSDDAEGQAAQVQAIAPGVPVHTISAIHTQGLHMLAPYLVQGITIALIGSSGAGKSTLINALAGRELQRVNEIRLGDGRGKHTTTHRELIVLPQGGIIIDTPGMRELQLNAADDGLSAAFEDIERLSGACRYRDCKHRREPGCAIQSAIASGELDIKRYQNYVKMEKELAYAARREKEKERSANKMERRNWKNE
ncbi:ribosome small subunit-dependent GTPase A [Paenibacillus nanensis]|uniref:Small ribosomal subunit biogenesis GTPase RsgA n=1 Tax=Paenibacillus nanensis TaxID=393251 RepID=A0A3A1VIL5_9BACL|nr:ribosome small subunit-dependent GTPase A [Paenibacillus nanensis]RIX60301.1 ribosome small subunit-dependent GTPase A [Paenibacillus nanensis]